ncbi:carbon-nitrogen hydrolase family protein [Marinibaculum pumilum]|uniref:Carbon-nitrogen hydrolase family protein n=1 Tax=Marinibaculum pumilum TaxID=1766165 RepID=A0ABV7KW75_9PROT
MTAPAAPPRSRIAVGQMNPRPGEVAANLAQIEAIARGAAQDGAALLVMPETATTGYFISDRLAELAEPEDGPTAARLGAIAKASGLHLAVGMAIAEGGRFYDSLLLFGSDGRRLATYHKAHLFAAERDCFAPGDRPVVVETAIGRIGLTVCYDLIFPDYVRRLVELGADVVINGTNWISDAWQRETWGWTGPVVQALAGTRALENGIWLAMADCTGPEAGFLSLGHSCIAAPSGRILASVGQGQGFAAADIFHDGADLARWRGIATYRQDRRPDLYR